MCPDSACGWGLVSLQCSHTTCFSVSASSVGLVIRAREDGTCARLSPPHVPIIPTRVRCTPSCGDTHGDYGHMSSEAKASPGEQDAWLAQVDALEKAKRCPLLLCPNRHMRVRYRNMYHIALCFWSSFLRRLGRVVPVRRCDMLAMGG